MRSQVTFIVVETLNSFLEVVDGHEKFPGIADGQKKNLDIVDGHDFFCAKCSVYDGHKKFQFPRN